VFDRLKKDEDFRNKHARAREAQAEAFVDELIDIADSSDKENAAAVRNRIEARKWVVGKILPKRYGDKPGEVNVSQTVNNTILTPEKLKELQERKLKALGR